jgi:hypothetical protein
LLPGPPDKLTVDAMAPDVKTAESAAAPASIKPDFRIRVE